MSDRTSTDPRAVALTALIVFQAVFAAVFIADVVRDAASIGGFGRMDWHLAMEVLATAGLVAAVLVEALVLRRMLARAVRTERAMGIAQGALQDLVESYFSDWSLTPAEADVASFTIKGYSIAEIAVFRGSAEGTVKTHLNAIYRKAGVSGRGQLVSLLIEDLMRTPLVNAPDRVAERAPAPPATAGTDTPPASLGPAVAAARQR